MNAGMPSSTTYQSLRLVNTEKLKTEIAERLPLSEVAIKLCDIELVPSGHQWKGLCPLHGENTPSFHVNDGKGVFHCFGCKAGGDAITLVREVRHLEYVEALALLASAANIDISEYQRPATAEEKKQDELRAWSERYLASLPTPSDGRIGTDTLKAFGVGVPQPTNGHAGVPDYVLRGTVAFPYRLANGKLVGWKVRAVDGDGKKMHFATPKDFPLAAVTFFGLQVAREHIENGILVVVEGEYDCLALHDAGIHNVVALGGSNFTDEHMKLLVDLKVRRVVFLMDGDEGGYTGAHKIAKTWWNTDRIEVHVGVCPAGADPEDMVGTGLLDQRYLAAQPGAIEYLLRQEYEREDRSTLTAKLEFVRWVQGEFKLSGIEEALVLKKIATWLDVPEADVLDFVRAEKTMLQAIDSEKVVLGRCIRDVNYYIATRKKVQTLDFYMLKHQRIWTALGEMLGEGLEFDLAVFRRRVQNVGVDPEYVDLLAQTGDLNIGWHEDQVIDYSVRRSAQADADRFREVIADLSLPANQLIGTLTHSVTQKALGRGSGAFTAIHEQVDEAMEVMHERMKNPDSIHGIDLGSQFPQTARSLQGFQPRRLVLVAATSGKGKSTLTLQWCAVTGIHRAIPTDFISLEMDTDEILFKLASHLTGIDSLKISGGRLDPGEAKRVEQAMVRIRNSPLRIYAPDGITPSEFVLYAREAVMERRSEIFVIDYAQMVGPDPETARENRYAQLGHFAYTAKQKIARALDVTVIACAQLKREAAGKEEPTPEDMGDSYELVRAADVILLLNENPESGMSELWVGKNRQGPGQILIPTSYDKPAQTFREAAGAKEPDYRILT